MPSIYTRSVKGEENPWQSLADAVVIQAVKDYRARRKMLRRLEKRLSQNKGLSDEERSYLMSRYKYHIALQDSIADFFFSEWFCAAFDLDGYDLLNCLEREVSR